MAFDYVFLEFIHIFRPLFKNKKKKTKITWLDYFTQGDIRVCEVFAVLALTFFYAVSG